VDGTLSQAISVNGTVTFVDLDDGPHNVELTGNRANCTVNEANPASANVPPNGTGTHNWTVTCVPFEGSLQVNVTTTGADQDPDGYTVRIDGDPLTDQSSLVTDVLTFDNLPVGSHTVDMRDRADNCVVAGGNPTTGTVQYNTTTSVDVQVICLAFEQTLVGAGDITEADTIGAGQTATLLDAIAPTATVFTLGDHVATGTASEFTSLYDPTWGRHLANTKPSPGNHEYDATVNAGPYFDYFGAEAGTRGEGWYAYNRGSWRIIVLNSWLSHGPGSAQFTWLINELQNNAKFCTLAYWHNPRFSSGEQTAPGDTTMQAVWDSLYAHGVELVLNGDAHLYERFARQDPNGNVDTQFGIRQITAGTGGSAFRSLRPAGPLANSQVQITNTWGVVKILLHEASYEWEFIEAPNAGTSPLDSGTDSCHGTP
jgi:hypothetical protein